MERLSEMKTIMIVSMQESSRSSHNQYQFAMSIDEYDYAISMQDESARISKMARRLMGIEPSDSKGVESND